MEENRVDRRSVLAAGVSGFAGLSGCASSASGGAFGTSAVKGCRSDLDDGLLLVRPTEPVSEETWAEIRRVVRERATNVVQHHPPRIHDQRIDGSRAITVAMYRRTHERRRELFLMRPTFTLYVGKEGDWTRVVDESSYAALGTVQRSRQSAFGKWYVPVELTEAGGRRLVRAISKHRPSPQIRTTVNGETIETTPVPDGLREAARERETITRMVIPIDDRPKRRGAQFNIAGKQPPFPVEVTTSWHECTDGARDEGDVVG